MVGQKLENNHELTANNENTKISHLKNSRFMVHYILTTGPPGPPENIRVVSSGPSFLHLQASLSRFGYIAVSSLAFVVTHADGNTTIVEAELKEGGVAEARIKGLMALTGYTVIAYATNHVGRSMNSTKTTFFTRKFPISP